MSIASKSVTSPDITTLAYSLLYDISGGLPTIVLTNASTVINPTLLKWWYVITSPSNTPIHTGSLASPDVNLVAWTTLEIASGSWPLLFGNPPCAQVEFSSNSPYVCTLYVKDSAGNTFSLPIIQTITRPNGNTQESCGNFGRASVTVQVNCNDKIVFCNDGTNFTYNNILTPSASTNEWILLYPPDPVGNQPANSTASGTPNVSFPIGYSGDGYVLNLLDFCTYDMGNGASIKVQYKAINPKTGSPGIPFAVLCNINLCKLQCQIQAFYELSKKTCNTVEITGLESKMTRMNFMFNQAIIGILQPLCGIDVPKIVREIQNIGNLDENCNCGCTDNGINFSFPTGPGNSAGGCCPVSTNVIDKNTGAPPALCPQSYFPVNVYDPTGIDVIGTANNINDLVAVINAYPAWQAYGIAFAEGNCKVGWFPTTGAETIPPVKIDPTGGAIIPPTKIIDDILIVGGSPPPACDGTMYPAKVYNKTATAVIGIANNVTELVSLLNGDPGWSVYGIASPIDSCHVQWALYDPAVIPDPIFIDPNTGGTGCVGGSVIYTVVVSDVCATSTLIPSDFPINAYVDFGVGGGIVSLGTVADMTALIAALNTTPTKPPSLSFAAGSALGQVIATNTDCVAYPGSATITADLGSSDFMLYGANHGRMIAAPTSDAAQQGFGLKSSSYIGKIPGFAPAGIVVDEPVWHTIKIGQYMLVTSPATAVFQVRMYDISNPLNPIFISKADLNDTGSGNCFTGIPFTATVASATPIQSIYGLYFPTDTPLLGPSIVYVVESTTGSIWKVDMTTGTVLASFTNDKLLGKCPRVIYNNTLYFTQDGDLETAGGLSSGVSIGFIVALDLTTFSSGGLSTIPIITNPAVYIWAASYDGSNTIWFVGQNGSLAKFDLPSQTVTNIYPNAFSFARFRLNIKCFLNSIYASSLSFAGKTTGTQRLITSSLPTITRTDFGNFTPPGSIVANNASHYNALPLGNCLVLVTYDNWADTSHPQGGIAVFAVDGTFIGVIQEPAGDIYNVIAIGGVSKYTPNSLV